MYVACVKVHNTGCLGIHKTIILPLYSTHKIHNNTITPNTIRPNTKHTITIILSQY